MRYVRGKGYLTRLKSSMTEYGLVSLGLTVLMVLSTLLGDMPDTTDITPDALAPHVGDLASLLPTMGCRSLFNLMSGLMAMRLEIGGVLTIHMPTKKQRAEIEWVSSSNAHDRETT